MELCNPFQSVGADGLIIIESSNTADLKWDFYNADGSSAEMCGNAARCMGLYAIKLGLQVSPQKSFSLKTKAGILDILVRSDRKILVQMTPVSEVRFKELLLIKDKKTQFDFINTGVPHSVLRVKELPSHDEPEPDIVGRLKNHKRFRPHSTNVTFYKELRVGLIESLTYERGITGFTQACGTGAVAAAKSHLNHVQSRRNKVRLPRLVQVNVPGGKLFVDLSKETPLLIGPAKFIADIHLYR